jgi:hypothetical protein
MRDRATFSEFVHAFRAQWFAAMSGGLSVPFAALAVWADSKYAQAIFAALAFAAVWFAAFHVWKAERKKVDAGCSREETRKQLAEIGKLRRRLVEFRVEMVQDQKGSKTEQEWEKEFGAIAAEITEKIRGFAGDAEADIYDARGNISRRFGPGTPPHQRIIDIVIHDLDHLREFIKDYSRGKDRTV